MGWSWLQKGAAAVGGFFIVEWFTSPEDQLVALSGAPEPGNISASERVRFTCEGLGGATCTCGDLNDWLLTYWKGTTKIVGLPALRKEALTLAEYSGKGNEQASVSVATVRDWIGDFKKKYGDPDADKNWEYDCDGDLWLGKSGQDRIEGVVGMIRQSQELHRQMRSALKELQASGKLPSGQLITVIPPNYRDLDERIYGPDDDKGPDSGSIGLGLLAGGAIALALIMGQSKDKGRV